MKYLQKPRLKHTYPPRHTKCMETCRSANTTNKITNRSFLYTYTSTQIKKRKDMHIHDILQMLPWNGVLYPGYSFKVRNVFLRTADLPINSSAMRSRFIFRLSSLCPWRRATWFSLACPIVDLKYVLTRRRHENDRSDVDEVTGTVSAILTSVAISGSSPLRWTPFPPLNIWTTSSSVLTGCSLRCLAMSSSISRCSFRRSVWKSVP